MCYSTKIHIFSPTKHTLRRPPLAFVFASEAISILFFSFMLWLFFLTRAIGLGERPQTGSSTRHVTEDMSFLPLPSAVLFLSLNFTIYLSHQIFWLMYRALNVGK